MTVGRPRWTSPSVRSTAWWSLDARTTSAPPDLKRGWGYRVRPPDPCNTLAPPGILAQVAATLPGRGHQPRGGRRSPVRLPPSALKPVEVGPDHQCNRAV